MPAGAASLKKCVGSVRLGAKEVVERSGDDGGFVISLLLICAEIASACLVGGNILFRDILVPKRDGFGINVTEAF